MSLIPEIQLKKIIDYYLNLIRSDYDGHTDKTHTFLFKVFGDTKIDGYDFYTQAKAIMLRSGDNKRKLETRLFFDRTRAVMPTIHINLPSEGPTADSLGYGIGNIPPEFSSDNSEYTNSKQRVFDTKYNITVTSDNTFEVIIVYTILKAIMISAVEMMELNGLTNPKISGRDLMVLDQTPTLYMRILGLDIVYEFTAPEIIPTKFANKIIFESKIDGIESVISDEELDELITYYYANNYVIQ